MAQPRFIFRLEPLLEHRKHIEREKQRKVADIQQQVNALIGKIQSAQQAITGENFRLTSEQLTGTLDIAYIGHQKRYVGSLQVLIITTMQKLQVIERQMAGARAELLEAARARKVIEKLKEKQYQRWLEEQNRKDAAMLDEIGTQLALRKLSEPDFDESHAACPAAESA